MLPDRSKESRFTLVSVGILVIKSHKSYATVLQFDQVTDDLFGGRVAVRRDIIDL